MITDAVHLELRHSSTGGLNPAGLDIKSCAVSWVRFSPDDALLAAADANGLVRVFRQIKETRS